MRPSDPKRAEARALDILRAALRCFVRTGFSATSMRQIAQEAGVSLGLLYRYFANKAAIVGAAIEADSGEFLRRLAELTAARLTEALLLDFLEREVALRSQPEEFALASEILAEAARDPRIAGLIRANIEAAEAALAEALLTMAGGLEQAGNAGKSRLRARHLAGLVDMLAARLFLGLDAAVRDTLRTGLALACGDGGSP